MTCVKTWEREGWKQSLCRQVFFYTIDLFVKCILCFLFPFSNSTKQTPTCSINNNNNNTNRKYTTLQPSVSIQAETEALLLVKVMNVTCRRYRYRCVCLTWISTGLHCVVNVSNSALKHKAGKETPQTFLRTRDTAAPVSVRTESNRCDPIETSFISKKCLPTWKRSALFQICFISLPI